ncbi:unnamed protein product [Amoebophrya sp. A120]|nr:unnamed protein product [Amoebophrya sp. A120]|eukprot:GSA120T00004544001.1
MFSRSLLLKSSAATSSRAPRRSRQTDFLCFEDAREVVRSLQLKSWREWLEWIKSGSRPAGIPSDPRTFYRSTGWNGFPDWLGYEWHPHGGPGLSSRAKRALRRSEKDVTGRLQTTTKQSIAGKAVFLEQAGNFFQFQTLPHRSIAQVVYRQNENSAVAPGSSVFEKTKWCPLVLRSVKEIRNNSLVFPMPKQRLGIGVVFVVTSSRQLFFFPFEFLDSVRLPGTKPGAPLRIKLDRAGVYEIRSSDAMQALLTENLQRSQLLSEDEFVSRLYSSNCDILLQKTLLQIVLFLRNRCGLNVQRPSARSRSLDAHFLIEGMPIMARSCENDGHQSYVRLDLGLCRNDAVPEDSHRIVSARLPDFLFAIARRDDVEQGAAADGGDFSTGSPENSEAEEATSCFDGVFIFPRAYLQAHYLRKFDYTGRTSIYVYPPWFRPTWREVGRKKEDQQRFFLDFSSNANPEENVAKAKRIFSEYRPSPKSPDDASELDANYITASEPPALAT